MIAEKQQLSAGFKIDFIFDNNIYTYRSTIRVNLFGQFPAFKQKKSDERRASPLWFGEGGVRRGGFMSRRGDSKMYIYKQKL